MIRLGQTPPLGSMPSASVARETEARHRKRGDEVEGREVPNFIGGKPGPATVNLNAKPKANEIDPLVALNSLAEDGNDPIMILNIDAIDATDAGGVSPPDPNHDVGLNHVIEITNDNGGSIFNVYAKDGTLIDGPLSLNPFWTSLGASGLGDPVVLYDIAADRWVLTEFAGNGNKLLVAVSETSDPLGTYQAYQYNTPDFPDYPKWSVWSNAYIVTSNEGGGEPIYAFEREVMLAGGLSPIVLDFLAPDITGGFEVMTPANIEGSTLPPAGSPVPIARMYDDAWGPGVDRIEVWNLNIDFDVIANSTLEGPLDIPVAAYDAEVCDGTFFDCVAQGNGVSLDAIKNVILHSMCYRNMGTHEAMVGAFPVNVGTANAERAGIRWFELRKTTGDWALYQEGTYTSTGDDFERFIPAISIAQDGGIAMGYSVANASNKRPSLRITGRNASDALGQMTYNETELVNGLSWHGNNRWGDYFSMSIDPADGGVFWFLGEYMRSGGNWGTRLAAFRLRKDTNDLTPVGLLTPVNSAYLTNAETITMQYKNAGYNPQTGYYVGYSVDGGAAFSEWIPGTIAPDEVKDYTFTSTADFSALGSHSVKLFTSLATDQNINNDTITVEVRKLTRWDAAVTAIDLPENNCGTSITGTYTITNSGQDPLTSCNITIQLEGTTVQTTTLPQTIAPGESLTLPLTVSGLADGTYAVTVITDSPSGNIDQDMSNDAFTRDFSNVANGETVTLTIVTDNYPEEVSWEIQTATGSVVAAGGTYAGQGSGPHTASFCLDPNLCYNLVLNDSYGDGLTSGGNPSLVIKNEQNQTLYSLSTENYGDQLIDNFCATFTCLLTLNYSVVPPGPNNTGSITLVAASGQTPYQYSINGGTSFQNGGTFNNVTAGTYEVVITDANGCSAVAQVEVSACTLTASYAVVNAITPNAGSITVTAAGGTTPYKYSKNCGTSYVNSNVFASLAAGSYCIAIKDATGCILKDTVDVGTTSTTEIQTGAVIVSVTPNPASENIQISVIGLQDRLTVHAQIINEVGVIVGTCELWRHGATLIGPMSIKDMPAGTYFVRIQDTRARQLGRFIKAD